MQLETESLTKIVNKIIATRPDEIDCDTCYSELDNFVDMLREGKKAEEVKPLVQHHLNMCNDCCEEFEALLLALDAVEA